MVVAWTGSPRRGEDWANSGCIWKRELRRITAGLYLRWEIKRGLRHDNFWISGSEQPSKWLVPFIELGGWGNLENWI